MNVKSKDLTIRLTKDSFEDVGSQRAFRSCEDEELLGRNILS